MDLLALISIPEEHLMEVEFRKDTAHGPHVNLGSVVLALVLEQELGRSKPPSDNVRRQIVLRID